MELVSYIIYCYGASMLLIDCLIHSVCVCGSCSVQEQKFSKKEKLYRICMCINHTFLTRMYPPKLGCGLYAEYYVLLATESTTPVLYVVKLPVETASV
jgi:hypothetical protein